MASFNLRGFDMNLLVVLEAIHDTGSITRAADQLALSQPAASHALARLRESLGDDLFVRTGQRLAPTPVASALLPAVRAALAGLRTGLAEARGFDPAASVRQFRIAIPHPMGPFLALSLRQAAGAVAPGVRLEFDTRSMPTGLEEALGDGTTDLAIDWLAAKRAQLVNRKLFEDRLVVIARAGHPRIDETVTLAGLRAEEMVWLHPRRPMAEWPRAGRQVFEAGFVAALNVSELLEIPAVVAVSDMFSLVPASIVERLAAALGFRVIAFPLKLAPLPIYAVWHAARRQDAGHRWLRELVGAELGRQVTRAG